MIKRNTGQSILEYAILLGVIIAGLLIMQAFVKRSYQGNLKDSADKIGEQYSAGETTIKQNRAMTTDQKIVEGVATTDLINTFKPAGITDEAKDVIASDVYSYTQRTGGQSTVTMDSRTSPAVLEKTRTSEYTTGAKSVDDYSLTDAAAEKE